MGTTKWARPSAKPSFYPLPSLRALADKKPVRMGTEPIWPPGGIFSNKTRFFLCNNQKNKSESECVAPIEI